MKKLTKYALLLAALAFGFASCKTNTDDEPVTYKVTYSTEHGTAPAAITVNENTVLTDDQLPALTAEGQTFDGWYDGDTKAVAGAYKVTKDVTLTAKWNVVSYTVTFNTNGGSEVTSQTVAHGSKATKPADNPTKTATEASEKI